MYISVYRDRERVRAVTHLCPRHALATQSAEWVRVFSVPLFSPASQKTKSLQQYLHRQNYLYRQQKYLYRQSA